VDNPLMAVVMVTRAYNGDQQDACQSLVTMPHLVPAEIDVA